VSSSIHLEAWFSKHEKDQINHIWVGGARVQLNGMEQ
jgi:hypothetical protein